MQRFIKKILEKAFKMYSLNWKIEKQGWKIRIIKFSEIDKNEERNLTNL